MKRIGIIFYSILLSLLIVVMSGGVTLVQCNHTGSMSVAQLSPHMGYAAEKDDCCGMKPECHCCHSHAETVGELPCMNYTLVKAQPTSFSQGFTLDFQPVCLVMPDFVGKQLLRVSQVIVKAMMPEGNGRHGPPRSYLRLITVLLI